MSDLTEQILDLLKQQPGLTDRAVTDTLRGAAAPQQPINQTCRNLERRGVIRRDRREDGRIGNYLVSGTLVNARSLPTDRVDSARVASGRLVCDAIDLNDSSVLTDLLRIVTELLREPSRWHRLVVDRRLYFQTPDGPAPRESGWYVICDGSQRPLYVGTADNLDVRLNSTNGSLDTFANTKRKQDPTRNFIKTFAVKGSINELRVGVVVENEVSTPFNTQGRYRRSTVITSKRRSRFLGILWFRSP